jgi:hypothetical protein
MFLAMRQESNKWSSQIDQRDRAFPISKWIIMDIIKVELCKIKNTLEKDLHGPPQVG